MRCLIALRDSKVQENQRKRKEIKEIQDFLARFYLLFENQIQTKNLCFLIPNLHESQDDEYFLFLLSSIQSLVVGAEYILNNICYHRIANS